MPDRLEYDEEPIELVHFMEYAIEELDDYDNYEESLVNDFNSILVEERTW